MAVDEARLPQRIFMAIDKSAPVPLYSQVASAIEKAIVDGELLSGTRLENEIALGERLGLSRPTVRHAIQELVDKGLLVRRRGIGTQVVQGSVRRNIELTSLFEDLENSNRHPTTKVLEHALVPAKSSVAEQLGIPVGSEVLYVRRLRLADDIPVSILINYLPQPFADLTAADLEAFGMYQLLRARGVNIRVAKQTLGARRATNGESVSLEIDPHGPLLTMDRTAFDSTGTAVEYGQHCYRPDRYAFEVTLVMK